MKFFRFFRVDISDKKQAVFRVAVAFAVMLVFLTVVESLFKKLVISFTGSAMYHIFVKEGKRFPLRGEYIVVKTPDSDKFTKGRLITKQAMCLPGDVLKIVNLDYYCCINQEEPCIHLGKAKLTSKKGEKVNPFNPCRSGERGIGEAVCKIPVPSGHVFAVNFHKDSYDSRYLGFIPESWIVAVVKPVF